MYNIIKNVINEKRYNLTGLLKRIDIVWLQGGISDEEKAELVKLAQNNANPDYSVDVIARLNNLEKRIRAIENNNSEGAPTEEYLPYDVNHVYLNGEKCSYEGKFYICELPENVETCNWSPLAYPAYWREVA